MRVYKFGGASIQNADGVKNIASIVKKSAAQNMVIVISAMGKMTNAFEELVQAIIKSENFEEELNRIRNYHVSIIDELYEEPSLVRQHVSQLFMHLESEISNLRSSQYDYIYDQIVSYGELLSTTIVSDYLNSVGIPNQWTDVRNLIKTDDCFRDAKVNWELTKARIGEEIKPNRIYVIQGFLGGTTEGDTTTLGREGSDYTAGIFAYCLDAEDVTIWKDVDGVLNADPRVFSDNTLLKQISYEETIEMAFYGASVVHPKTIQPLQSKEIPLYVKSFVNPSSKGTKVSRGVALSPKIPCYIVKKNQILISIASKDFSFIVEDNIRFIFQLLHEYQLKVSLIQNSAISFSVCVDNKFKQFDTFLAKIASLFRVQFHKGVDLYTIRHFTDKSIQEIEQKGIRLLRQTTQETTQIVIQSNPNI